MNNPPDLHAYRGRIQDLDSHLQVPIRRYPELMGKSGELIFEQFMARAAGTELARILDPDGDEAPVTPENIWNVKGPTAPGAGNVEGRL